MFDLYVASFPSIPLLFFWNICVKFLHVSNSAVVSSPLSRQSKYLFKFYYTSLFKLSHPYALNDLKYRCEKEEKQQLT